MTAPALIFLRFESLHIMCFLIPSYLPIVNTGELITQMNKRFTVWPLPKLS